MTTNAGTQFAALQDELNDDKAWARTEDKQVLQLVELSVTPATEDWMTARQIPYESAAFKAAYADGFPVLNIGLKGLSVHYEFAEDGVRRFSIPLMGDRPERYGERKGRRSQSHIVSDAFVKVFGMRPFGDNIPKLIGTIAWWGQHFGEFDDAGEQREWAWDVPREKLPADYKWPGEVTVRRARAGAGGAGTGGVGTVEVSADEATTLITNALIGLKTGDKTAASERIFEIQGLPGEWYDAATAGEVMKKAYELGLVDAGDDDVVFAKVAEPATA